MPLPDTTVSLQRWTVAAALLGSAVIMVPGAVLSEPFMLPKITWLWACSLVLVGAWAARALHQRRVSVPAGAVGVVLGVLVLALVLATVLSPRPWTSLIGYFSRYTGLAAYLSHLVVLVTVLGVADLPFLRRLLRTAVVGLTVVVGYGLVQAAGWDPVTYVDTGLGTTFSTMGNTNFGGAFAGAVLPLALAVAADRHEQAGWRWYAAGVVPATLVYVVATGTVQGPLVALVGGGLTLLVLLSAEGSRVRAAVAARPRAALAGLAAAVLGGAVLAGLARETLSRQIAQSLSERREFWSAAVGITRDNPVLGTGLDTFAFQFLAYRPASHALVNGTATTDAPHNVPLGMLTNGGIPLFLAWLALLVLVAAAVVHGLRQVQGAARPVLAGLAGTWAGYLAQSLISFDQPPLALLHVVSAGGLLALTGRAGWRSFALPGSAPSPRLNKRGKPVGPVVVPASTRAATGAVVAVLLVVGWFALYPLRADRAAAQGAALAGAGRVEEALAALRRASELNPGEARYAFVEAQFEAQVGRTDRAVAAAEEAARRDPGPVEYALLAARQAEMLGDAERAHRWYVAAGRRDPQDPPVLNEVAVHHLVRGEPDRALALLQRSARILPDNTETLVVLGRAHQAVGDTAAAREAFEKALALDPANEEAQRLLAELAGAAA